MSLALEIPVKKSTYERWKPNFNLSEDKKNVFATGLEKELCNFSIFERKTPEEMYTEILRAINRVGLMVSKRRARRFDHIKPTKLKRLTKYKHSVLKRQHTATELEEATNKWQQEANAYKSRRAEEQRRYLVCLFVCLFVCLSVCLVVCLSSCLFV